MLVFVGTYTAPILFGTGKILEGKGEGIYAFRLDLSSGRLDPVGKTPGVANPSYLAIDASGRFLYAVNELKTYEGQPTGTVSAFTLDPSMRFAFVPDLGLDKLMVYRFDAERGMLEPHTVPWVKVRPGAGPRHVALHPGGRFADLVNELDSTVVALRYDATPGTFESLQCVPALPAGFTGASTCADIEVHPSGRFLYASKCGHDSIVIHRIDPATGRLDLVAHASTEGRTPRSFGIDPSGCFLLVANQDSDSIVTFRIDPECGGLVSTGHATQVPTPVCVKLLASNGAPAA